MIEQGCVVIQKNFAYVFLKKRGIEDITYSSTTHPIAFGIANLRN